MHHLFDNDSSDVQEGGIWAFSILIDSDNYYESLWLISCSDNDIRSFFLIFSA